MTVRILKKYRVEEKFQVGILPPECFSHLHSRQWTYIAAADERLPNWVSSIPAKEQLKFLASGPAFPCTGRDELLINSEKLFAWDYNQEQEQYELSKRLENWYLLLADSDFQNLLVTDPPKQHIRKWLVALRQALATAQVHLVPKHPEQDGCQMYTSRLDC